MHVPLGKKGPAMRAEAAQKTKLPTPPLPNQHDPRHHQHPHPCLLHQYQHYLVRGEYHYQNDARRHHRPPHNHRIHHSLKIAIARLAFQFQRVAFAEAYWHIIRDPALQVVQVFLSATEAGLYRSTIQKFSPCQCHQPVILIIVFVCTIAGTTVTITYIVLFSRTSTAAAATTITTATPSSSSTTIATTFACCHSPQIVHKPPPQQQDHYRLLSLPVPMLLAQAVFGRSCCSFLFSW